MRLLLALIAALALAAPAHAQVPALGPDARVFTVAGGTERPRENLPAYRADLTGSEELNPVGLPNGDIAVVAGRGRPWLIGLDARLHGLPRLAEVTLLAGSGDGALYAVRRDEDVRRLAPGATAWTPVPGATGEEVDALAGLPDGGVALAYDAGVSMLDASGAVVRRFALPEGEASALATLPDGGLVAAVDGFTDASLQRWSPAGGWTHLGRTPYGSEALAALPDGTILRGGDQLDAIAPSGSRVARIWPRDALADGDGAPPAASELLAGHVAAAPDGSVLVGQLDPRPAWDFIGDAVRIPRRGVVATDLTGRTRISLRLLAPPGTARPLAALGPRTFAAIRRGEVQIESTVAGTATVIVRQDGREVTRGTGEVPAGSSALALEDVPPIGDLTVELVLVAANGAVAGARVPVSTLPALRARDARAVVRRVRNGLLRELGLRLAGCTRRDGVPVRCVLRGELFDEPACWRVRIQQRPDGRRALVSTRFGRRCR